MGAGCGIERSLRGGKELYLGSERRLPLISWVSYPFSMIFQRLLGSSQLIVDPIRRPVYTLLPRLHLMSLQYGLRSPGPRSTDTT